ncbi:Protein kinase domain-containing protein [Balamuthia mandrillaris]
MEEKKSKEGDRSSSSTSTSSDKKTTLSPTGAEHNNNNKREKRWTRTFLHMRGNSGSDSSEPSDGGDGIGGMLSASGGKVKVKVKPLEPQEKEQRTGKQQLKKLFHRKGSSPLFFGGTVEEAVQDDSSGIPRFLEQAFSYLEERGMLVVEGLFRLPGSKTEIEDLRKKVNSGRKDFGEVLKKRCPSAHTVCGLIKLYLRQLKEPLLTFERYQLFTVECVTADKGNRLRMDVRQLQQALRDLPPANRAVLRRLLLLLRKVAAHHALNRMNAVNLGLVFGPALLRYSDEKNVDRLIDDTNKLCFLGQSLIALDDVLLFEDEARTPKEAKTPKAPRKCPLYYYSDDTCSFEEEEEKEKEKEKASDRNNNGDKEVLRRKLLLSHSDACPSWEVYLVSTLLSCDYDRAVAWPDFDDQATICLLNGNELHIYPYSAERGDEALISAYTSDLYGVVDSTRYFFIYTAEEDVIGIIFAKREDSSHFKEYMIEGHHPAPASGGSEKRDALSREFSEHEQIADGWFDVGAARSEANVPLEELRLRPINVEEPEIILVDKNVDKKLRRIVKITRLLCSKFPTFESKVRLIALQVSSCMGGSFSDDSQMLYDSQSKLLKQKLNSNLIPIGFITHGLNRQRVILFKYLCDHCNPPIPCTITMTEQHTWVNLVPVSSNINRYKAIDLMMDPGRLRTQESIDRKLILQSGAHLTMSMSERHIILPDLQTEELIFQAKLGSGAFSSVYRCSLGPISCAVKVYQRSSIESIGLQLARECMIQTRLLHKNVLRCMGYEQTSDEFFIFFEYCGGGSFWDLLAHKRAANECFTPKQLQYYATEVASGLHYLHENNIYHRDIKSANILLDGDPYAEYYQGVKLCDFNISTRRADSITKAGTPQYMAPELLSSDNSQMVDNEKADIWSFGMFLMELVTLDAPYAGLPEQEYLSMIKRGELPPNVPSADHSPTIQLARRCCQMDPQSRPSAKDILTFLSPFS